MRISSKQSHCDFTNFHEDEEISGSVRMSVRMRD